LRFLETNHPPRESRRLTTMTNKGIDIKPAKERGEWAELRFMARAAEEGLVVTKPWGESSRYDFAVERSGRFLRVQVKSTLCRKNNSYPLNLHGAQAPYSIGDFDFVAAYVIPLDLWYIIPAEAAITGREKLYVTPGSPKTRYEQYREAWHLLFGESNNRHVGTATQACTERSRRGRPSEQNSAASPAAEETSPDDAPPSLAESRFGAIKWSPFLSHWKPRR
jgi:hypothetical protein